MAEIEARLRPVRNAAHAHVSIQCAPQWPAGQDHVTCIVYDLSSIQGRKCSSISFCMWMDGVNCVSLCALSCLCFHPYIWFLCFLALPFVHSSTFWKCIYTELYASLFCNSLPCTLLSDINKHESVTADSLAMCQGPWVRWAWALPLAPLPLVKV